MKKFSLYLLLLGVILLIMVFYRGSDLIIPFTLNKPYKAKVERIAYGNTLILSNNKIVILAGIFIPYKGSNYRRELMENISNLLAGKYMIVKEILKYTGKGDAYPRYPLVEAYFENGTMINAKLLEEGMAFFDHGYYKGKEKFEKLQEEAKINKRGIWGNKNPPVVIYLSSKKWRFVHYPECPESKKIKEEDKIEYYFLPPVVFGAKYFTYDCKYCKEIEKDRGIDRDTHDYMQP